MKKFLRCFSGRSRRMQDDEGLPALIDDGESMTSVGDVEDNIRGCLYGHCIGDALGLLTEFMNKEQSMLTYGEYEHLEYEHKVNDFHRARWEMGDWTDDSDQMILIMQMLLEKNKVDPVDYGQRLWKWGMHGFEELGDLGGMGIGATTKKVLNHESFNTDPHYAAEDIWNRTGCFIAPNGAVMRTSVIGIHRYQDLKTVIDNAKNVCKVTHADTRCIASCVAVTSAISFMLKKRPKYLLPDGSYNVDEITKDSYETAKVYIQGKHSKKHKNELKEHMFAKNLTVLRLDDKQSIGYTFKALGAGFWALRQQDFRAAIEALILEGGDADSNGSVAGALLGCKVGAQNLPPSWRDELLHKEWLDGLIAQFLQLQEGKMEQDNTASDPESNSSADQEEVQADFKAPTDPETQAEPQNGVPEEVEKSQSQKESESPN